MLTEVFGLLNLTFGRLFSEKETYTNRRTIHLIKHFLLAGTASPK